MPVVERHTKLDLKKIKAYLLFYHRFYMTAFYRMRKTQNCIELISQANPDVPGGLYNISVQRYGFHFTRNLIDRDAVQFVVLQ